MYPTVQFGMAPSQARERLLAAVVAHALCGAITAQSLREIAAAVGTSHRMLLYHFGSREGLLVAISNAINDAENASLDRWGDLWELWEYYTDPEAWPFERLFFELYAHALNGHPGFEGFFEASVHGWITGLAGELVKAGADESTARIEARLFLAVARGLVLDLLATGDREGVNQAYERFLRLAGHSPVPPRTGSVPPRTSMRPL
jgi:AcrR family transcriptional regulator